MVATSQKLATASGEVPACGGSEIKLSPVGWIASEHLGYAEWVAAGGRLGLVGRSSQWWVGDWIRFGNARFGERYVRAARITGYDIQTLTNMVYVANSFDISRRRENLSWSHHEALAAYSTLEQERWFERALAGRWSVADLRTELRSARRLSRPRAELSEDPGHENHEQTGQHDVLLCPECGYPITGFLSR